MFKLILFTMLLINVYSQSPSNVGIQGVNITHFVSERRIPFQMYFRTSGDDSSKFSPYGCYEYCEYNRFRQDITPTPQWNEYMFQLILKAMENKWLLDITYCKNDQTKEIEYGIVCGIGITLDS
ncbi:hypothetical protein I4U23_011134 [Adineta vaga]|nr:hypothetical protein I4U23_011134 [Adineta vaga]